MSSKTVFVLFLCGSFPISSCFQADTEDAESAGLETMPGVLTGAPEVVDGDTIKIQGENIRLAAIDAPEKRQLCRSAEGGEYPCGIVATEALETKVGNDVVYCEEEDRDFYRRVVGTCYLENLDLNGWMVEQGHALAYRQYSERYIPEEESACENRRGIWAGEFIPPWEWRRGERLENGTGTQERPCD